METKEKTVITIETRVNAPVQTVWKSWTMPEHITQWNQASPDWHCPKAENDVRIGGKFTATMAARDGSMSFDFGGIYDNIEINRKIAYTIGDGRRVEVDFLPEGNQTRIVESFEAEGTNPVEMQRNGWQSILDNFKRYTESLYS